MFHDKTCMSNNLSNACGVFDFNHAFENDLYKLEFYFGFLVRGAEELFSGH